MHESMQILGWTLVHFLWQGMVVALITAAALRACGRSASARYIAACAGLALMLASPALTFAFLASPRVAQERDVIASSAAAWPAAVAGATALPAFVAPGPGVRASVEAILPAFVTAWVAGVGFLLARFAGGCWKVRRIAKVSLLSRPSAWQLATDRLASRLGLVSAVHVRDSMSVSTPTVIGWLRPVIVLPAAAFANLTPLQVEAVLAHELAHVRRHDYAVNLAQTIAEVLLFYHPGVWWLSGRIREEREHCCDDVAIAVCGEPHAYVEALTELEAWRSRGTSPALAATDGSLLRRARRLLRAPEDPGPRSLIGLLSLLGGLSALTVIAIAASSSPPVGEETSVRGTPSAAVPAYQAGGAAPLPPGGLRLHSTAHFDVYHPPDLDLHAERVGRDAERAYDYSSAELEHDLAFKVPILVLRTTSELPAFDGLHADPLAEPSRRRIVFAVDRPSAEWPGLIAHEVAHVFGFDIIPGSTTPRWLVEGLAEYQRNSWDMRDLVALRDAVRTGGMPDIARLTAGDAGGDPRLLDSVGHAAFEFVEARWGKDGVRRFVFALRRAAVAGGEPYEAALGVTAQQFERAFGEYLQSTFSR